MSSPINWIGKYDLTPGLWVVFDHESEAIAKELKGPFKVINRDDSTPYDACRCFLMNFEGKLMDYAPRVNSLNHKHLPLRYQVKIVKREEIGKILGAKLDEVESKAFEHLKSLAEQDMIGKGFDPGDESVTLTGLAIREKFDLTLRKR